MIAVVISCVLVIASLIIFQKSRKLKGPINEKEENHLPARLSNTGHNVQLAYIYLAAWVISKNSRNSQEKAAFIHTWFKANFEAMDVEISDELTKALKFSTNIRSISRWVIKRMRTAKERLQLIDFLIGLSFADGDIIDREYVAIARFADLIGMNVHYVEKEVYTRRKAIYEGAVPSDMINGGQFFRRKALFSLQLMDNAGKEDIKRAYRKLASRYHPDKFQQSTEEEQLAAAQKFMEIKEAYDLLSGK